jgi:NADPH2:quinone reductase
MKAMVITAFGKPEVFKEMTLPVPEVKPHHVLIKVVATSVNPFDCKMRQGAFADLAPTFPMVLQGDVAGVIEKIGQGVDDFVVGDAVYGCVGGLLDMGGGLAEYVLADAALIAHKPKTLSFLEAAALPLVSITAWEGLISYAHLQKNQDILIHGGTGGVGHIAIQLAKSLGAKVYTSCSSAKKMQITRDLGADVSIDYCQQSVAAYVEEYTDNQGFDVVFDTVGGDNLPGCFAAAKLFGQVASILAAGPVDLTPAFLKGLSLHLILQPLPLITGKNRAHYGDILAKIATLVDEGLIRPLIDERRFMVQEVSAAHAYLEAGQAIGKVVLMQL